MVLQRRQRTFRGLTRHQLLRDEFVGVQSIHRLDAPPPPREINRARAKVGSEARVGRSVGRWLGADPSDVLANAGVDLRKLVVLGEVSTVERGVIAIREESGLTEVHGIGSPSGVGV